MKTSVNGNSVSAKTALSHVRGMQTILTGAVRLVEQFGGDTEQIQKKLDNLEYIEATLVATQASRKSGLKAGVAAGFRPTRLA